MQIIRPTPDSSSKQGDAIETGGIIKLQHMRTRRWLHSHLHASPLFNLHKYFDSHMHASRSRYLAMFLYTKICWICVDQCRIPGKYNLFDIEFRISIIRDFSKEFHRIPLALGSQAQTFRFRL